MASGVTQLETFLFSPKLRGRGRSFRFRSSFAFNEDPLNIQKHRVACFYTQERGFFSQKTGSSHQFLNYRLLGFLLLSFIFPFLLSPMLLFSDGRNKGERNIKS